MVTAIQKILLTGATGFIGGHLNAALVKAGYEVIPVSRASGGHFDQFTSAADWYPNLENIDAVINAVGIIVETRTQKFKVLHDQAPSALFQACADLGIKRVVQISALGADDKAFTPYQLSKKAADDALRALDLDWFVLRPSLVYGTGGASMQMFQRLSRLPVIPLIGDGQYRVQPVHISDLVDTTLVCLNAEKTQQTIDVVGPVSITFKDWLQSFRISAQRKPAMTLSIPFNLMLMGAALGRFVMPLMHPDNLRMLRQGNVADVAPLTKLLGRTPLTVEEGLCLI